MPQDKNKKSKYCAFAAAAVAALMFFSAADASADYYNWGVLKSDNILSGATVTAIAGFRVTSSIPAGGAVSVQFSQDGTNFYSSTGTQWGWDTLSSGDHLEAGVALDLSGLHWGGDGFLLQIKIYHC